MYSLKLELKLNNKERSKLKGCAGFRRFVYNFGLSLVKDYWNFAGRKVSDSKIIDAVKKILTNDLMNSEQYKWMKSYPSTIYQSALQDLKTAFSRYRKGTSRLPVFKNKKKCDSFTVYKTSGIYLKKGLPALPFTNRVVLHSLKKIDIPGLGKFRTKERIPYICSSQTFTISRTADKWYCSFLVDAERVPPISHPIVAITGVDLGIKCFATLSDGSNYEAPQPLKKAKIKLAKLQWRNRRKQKGNLKLEIKTSNNAKKYFDKLAIFHAEISNKRLDFLHKTTTKLCLTYSHLRIEDLNVAGMVSNHKLASAISDNGFYEFKRQLEYKGKFYSSEIELVNRWYPSSKTCSSCGHIQSMPLSQRVFNCNSCGLTLDRDLNASVNLARAPLDKVVRLA